MPKRAAGAGKSSGQIHDQILQHAVEAGASDVHIAVGSPVFYRVNGALVAQTNEDVTSELAESIAKALLGGTAYERFQRERELDASYQLRGGPRFRVNCSVERGSVTIAARTIPDVIPTVDTLDLKDVAESVCALQDGLVLFVGPTGTGKSTSLASLINAIHQSRAVNVVTLEDPIEFLFPKGKGIVRQRQYGQDFLAFPEALKRVLRQDPDIILVGEMRDPETIAAALTLAETGHLTFATLHTPNTWQTVDRIIDVFPSHQQAQIRSQISFSLRTIISQRLVPAAKGGLVALREVLVNTPAVGNIIRESRLHELRSVLQTGSSEGMYSFEQDLKRLRKSGIVSDEVAEEIEESL
ncbi:MAG: twitching motility protein PilT [Candidatus Peregrinibacteria bacterium Gr01-1014_25]|nr:MAG: twitching motility protein PilT [Candidatus Peregrinibacteria bacterium Gr01-1014_25]